MSPVIFEVGSFRVQWYGLMYLAAFFLTYLLARYRMRTEKRFQMHDDDFLKDLLTWAFVGVLLGGRFGYVFFYNFEYYLQHPLEIIFPFRHTSNGWQFTGISGMSYHGGLIGAIMGPYLFCRKHKADFWNLCDLFFPIAPLGYTFGRIGNFINGELWGRETTSAWGMRFPEAPGTGLRHPSQLYEAFFEGIMLFIILFVLRKKNFPKGSFTGLYLIGYGIFRFGIEFVRQPDAHLGLLFFNAFSMGQALCFAMIAVGVGIYVYRAMVASKTAQKTTSKAG